jgi:hypothetical protein
VTLNHSTNPALVEADQSRYDLVLLLVARYTNLDLKVVKAKDASRGILRSTERIFST